jgi:hypothetical protein
VHQSCGKKFTDPDEDCVYHPGPPIFHEGQKGRYKKKRKNRRKGKEANCHMGAFFKHRFLKGPTFPH